MSTICGWHKDKVPQTSRILPGWRWRGSSGIPCGWGHFSEYDRRIATNDLFTDGHAGWKRLSGASTARYGLGPDLHGVFREDAPLDPLSGEDFVP